MIFINGDFIWFIRLLKPASYWPEFKRAFDLNKDPYCNSQQLVFEAGAEAPKPNSKVKHNFDCRYLSLFTNFTNINAVVIGLGNGRCCTSRHSHAWLELCGKPLGI